MAGTKACTSFFRGFMKRIVVIFACAVFLFSCNKNNKVQVNKIENEPIIELAQENIIWGVWNSGSVSNITRTITTVDGTFLYRGFSTDLVFFSDFYGRGAQIMYDGGGCYDILTIIGKTADTISLYIEEMQPSEEILPNNRRKIIAVHAKIVLNFIDEDHMWIEIDYNDPEYPTPQWFRATHFINGKSLVYWRQRLKDSCFY